jgi:orotate phosphoribosyltransferase-like protein
MVWILETEGELIAETKARVAAQKINRTEKKNQRLIDIRNLRSDGLTYREIGEKLGIRSSRVQGLVRANIPELIKNTTKEGREDRLGDIINLRNDGLTYREIGDKVGISSSRAQGLVKANRPELTKSRTKEERKDRLRKIVDLRSKGFIWQRVADHTGISLSGLRSFVKLHQSELREIKLSDSNNSKSRIIS